jgi:hypothetical protein
MVLGLLEPSELGEQDAEEIEPGDVVGILAQQLLE